MKKSKTKFSRENLFSSNLLSIFMLNHRWILSLCHPYYLYMCIQLLFNKQIVHDYSYKQWIQGIQYLYMYSCIIQIFIHHQAPPHIQKHTGAHAWLCAWAHIIHDTCIYPRLPAKPHLSLYKCGDKYCVWTIFYFNYRLNIRTSRMSIQSSDLSDLEKYLVIPWLWNTTQTYEYWLPLISK